MNKKKWKIKYEICLTKQNIYLQYKDTHHNIEWFESLINLTSRGSF